MIVLEFINRELYHGDIWLNDNIVTSLLVTLCTAQQGKKQYLQR